MSATPPMSMISTDSDFAEAITHLFFAITAVDVGILVLVVVLVALAVFKYSRRDEGLGTEVPHERQFKLEVAWTVGPALILAVVGTISVRMTFKTQAPVPPGDSLEVDVTGQQWWWDVRYPSLGVTTANEIHVPTGQRIRFRLRSRDVVHSFWVPRLGGKRDLIPGQTNDLAFVANTPGAYPGECSEFCGTSHANMRFMVFVQTPEDFERWVADQSGPPRVAARPDVPAGLVLAGAQAYAASSCTPCHTIGPVSRGTFGPNLTHFASRTTFAGGTVENTPENVEAWIRNPAALKPGAKMPALGVSEPQVKQLVAYLESLE